MQLVGVPSSSTLIDPLLESIVPSSTIVTESCAIFSPIKFEKAEVFFLLKSPSKPWPIASCRRIPGKPGPRTTSISPTGESTDWRLISAWAKAPSTCFCQ